ncbi:MAG TPA: flagellar basal-body MS-ring/collar protein FliF [Steroidobacteraceae bacterium]|nr:flagellar basal-body MS-ring/collar protein FliF [Steroidobacteraceae bacterium]
MTAEVVYAPPSRMPAGIKPLLLLIGVAAAVAAGVSIVLWSQGPSYSLLFGNLGTADASQVVTSLEQAGIPYRVESGSGAITVPSDRVSDARMKLAAKGLPESGGFSLMEKDPGFGVSQFMESARYQHALETELARTIASLKQVEAARVHLAVPQQSAFVRDRRPGSASVFLQLKSGRRLEREQVTSIINLVASSIPELEASQVTVVDNQGRLLSAPERDGEFAQREEQMDMARRMEEDYSQRIESLLTPMLGTGRIRAQVVAQIEMSATEEAREQYRPESQIVRSEQTSEDVSRNGATAAGGIPGSLTNQPPQGGSVAPPVAAAAAPAPGAAASTPGAQPIDGPPAAPDNTSRQSTRNYEIDRTIAYTRQPAGRLQRLSVAVLVDNLRTTDTAGKVTETPLTEEQIARVTTLVKDAVGFDEKRGDSVSVINQGFHSDAVQEVPEMDKVPIWEQPLMRDVAKLVAGLVIVVLLLLFVVRPLIKSLALGVRALSGPQGSAGVEGMSAAPAAMLGQSQAPVTAIAYEQQVAQVRSMVAKDPARAAQVVKGWVQGNE